MPGATRTYQRVSSPSSALMFSLGVPRHGHDLPGLRGALPLPWHLAGLCWRSCSCAAKTPESGTQERTQLLNLEGTDMPNKLHVTPFSLVLWGALAGLTTLGCAHSVAPKRVRYADINSGALQRYTGAEPLIIEYQPGDRRTSSCNRSTRGSNSSPSDTASYALAPTVSAQAPILITSIVSQASREASAWDSVPFKGNPPSSTW